MVSAPLHETQAERLFVAVYEVVDITYFIMYVTGDLQTRTVMIRCLTLAYR